MITSEALPPIATARSPVTSTPVSRAMRTAARSASLALPSIRRCSAALSSVGPDVIDFKRNVQERKFMCYGADHPPKKRSGPTCALNTTSTLDYQPSDERMTIMANHSSASVRETPHVTQTSRTNTIIDALKERAQAVLNDQSIDAPSRAIIRYALETNDPLLAELVRRADAG